MNPIKQHKKLINLTMRAQQCVSREEARALIRKADKAHKKISKSIDLIQRDN